MKKANLETFLRIVARIASKEYQKRAWIDMQSTEFEDFDEIANCFSDCYGQVIHYTEDFDINNKQKELLIDFEHEFRTFYLDNDLPQLFIDSPEWTHITEKAENLLKAFNYKKRLK